jgi:hypothetical protein
LCCVLCFLLCLSLASFWVFMLAYFFMFHLSLFGVVVVVVVEKTSWAILKSVSALLGSRVLGLPSSRGQATTYLRGKLPSEARASRSFVCGMICVVRFASCGLGTVGSLYPKPLSVVRF